MAVTEESHQQMCIGYHHWHGPGSGHHHSGSRVGHFIIARMCGVRVDCFRLGWPKIVWMESGATDWRISAITVGGYFAWPDRTFRRRFHHVAPTGLLMN